MKLAILLIITIALLVIANNIGNNRAEGIMSLCANHQTQTLYECK